MQNFSCSALLRCRLNAGSCLRVRGFHPLWRTFPDPSPDNHRPYCRRSYNPRPAVTGRVWAAARSLATTCAITFVFSSSGYLDVSVPRVCPVHRTVPTSVGGLPHSDICASMSICLSTQLFAACHVLRRLREPRHPSCALFSFPFFLESSLLTAHSFSSEL